MKECNECGIQLDFGRGYCYTDNERGLNSVTMCWKCTLSHVERYFGDCPASKSIRLTHSEEIARGEYDYI